MSSENEQLADLLEHLLFERGINVQQWPADELALHRHPGWICIPDRNEAVRRLRFEKAAAALLVAGWLPPPRVIETREELEALPVESFVQVIDPALDLVEPQSIVWVQGVGGEWVEPGSADRHPADEVGLPAWLRWTPPTSEPQKLAQLREYYDNNSTADESPESIFDSGGQIKHMTTDRPSITCPQCDRTSYNPNDIKNKYCGNCRKFQ